MKGDYTDPSILAHQGAFNAGYIHRDISSGNVLLYENDQGIWCGMLTDWELSKKIGQFKPRQIERTVRFASKRPLLLHLLMTFSV